MFIVLFLKHQGVWYVKVQVKLTDLIHLCIVYTLTIYVEGYMLKMYSLNMHSNL